MALHSTQPSHATASCQFKQLCSIPDCKKQLAALPRQLRLSCGASSSGRRSGQAQRLSTLRNAAATGVMCPPTAYRLTKADLVATFADGCKPHSSQWRIGTEHEKLAYISGTRQRAKYSQIRHILDGLCSRYGWTPVEEGGRIVGCQRDGQSVTLEPGGQLELSGAPVATLHETCREASAHLAQVNALAAEVDVCFLALGYGPTDPDNEVPPICEHPHFENTRSHLANTGSMGWAVATNSTTVQVNLDYASEADMIQMTRVGMALQPVATALFANSPFHDGEPSGFLSWRSQAWQDTDQERTGILPFVFEDGFGFERYTDFLLDIPMRYVKREGMYITTDGQSFRDFLAGRLPAAPGLYPTTKDWEVRMKKFLEMRGADGGSNICSLSAFWVGLLYDKEVQQQAADLIADWTPQEVQQLRAEVPRLALKTPFRNSNVLDIARQVLALSHKGLKGRGLGEERYLQPLHEIADSGVTLAERLLDCYYGCWEECVDPAFGKEYHY